MKRRLIEKLCVAAAMLFATFAPASVEVTATEWSGTPTDFYGFDLYSFTESGLSCKVAVPKVVAEGKPWVWRARFWGHEPGPDVALLGKGYHVVYVDVVNLFGCPTAVTRFDAFYDFLTNSHGFDERAVLEGMSRGGLIIYNWAAQNPDKVHCIYADAPVCDFKSWPAGLYDGDESPSNWSTCLAAYGFTGEQALAYGGNPVDNMQPLAAAGIPLLHVVGDIDTVVPVAENTAIVENRYKAFGGWIEVIHKSNVGHVHGLDDPSPMIDFILNGMNDIHNLPATSVTKESATLNGLLSLPGTHYEIQVHWGTTDGGSTPAAWDHSATLGSWVTGVTNLVSYDVSSLAVDSANFYSFSASNETESIWDDAVTVNTIVGYWSFDGNTDDRSGFLRHGIVGDDEVYATGIIDQAMVFDGMDDYVQITGYKGITGTASRTCTAWINTSTVNGSILIWGDTSVNGRRWDLRLQDFGGYPGRLMVSVKGAYRASRRNLADGNWHHVAAVLEEDGTPSTADIKLYIDGVADTDVDTVDYPINTASFQDVIIGSSVSYFNGLIDDVRIYGGILNDYRIAALYFQGRPDSEICLSKENDLQYDYTADCQVDLSDAAVLASQWLGSTDTTDLVGLASEWLMTDLYSASMLETSPR